MMIFSSFKDSLALMKDSNDFSLLFDLSNQTYSNLVLLFKFKFRMSEETEIKQEDVDEIVNGIKS